MKTRPKLLAAAVVAALGTTVAMSVPALAHGSEGQRYQGQGYGQGHGYGMMGQGHGQGHSMMGHGQGHGQGMMGRGYGHGFRGDCGPGGKTAGRNLDLSVDDVTKMLEGRLIRRGNDRLKVGKVEAKDENTIIAEIVTTDNSLVDRFEIDRKSGRKTRVK